MDSQFEEKFMARAVELSKLGSEGGHGGPFGAVIVKDGQIIGEGYNKVTTSNDPSAHAEIVAIREACKNLNTFQLDGCLIYTSCEPCPMCLGAIYWARPSKVYFANSKNDAADAGFDDAFIYNEIGVAPQERNIPMIHQPYPAAKMVFDNWKNNPFKIAY